MSKSEVPDNALDERTAFRDDLEHVITYMQEQADDRTLAIVGAAYCERYAKALLEYQMTNLTKKISKELFDGSSPLATASARYRLCYAMNLIDEVTYTDVKILAKIRNRFAHHIEVKDCNDQNITGLVSSFSAPQPPERNQHWALAGASIRLRWKSLDLVTAFHNGLNDILRVGPAKARPASVVPLQAPNEDAATDV